MLVTLPGLVVWTVVAAFPANDPAREGEQEQRLELRGMPTGGLMQRGQQKKFWFVILDGNRCRLGKLLGCLVDPENPDRHRYIAVDEGAGRMKLMDSAKGITHLGRYRKEAKGITVCVQEAVYGLPAHFQPGEHRYILYVEECDFSP